MFPLENQTLARLLIGEGLAAQAIAVVETPA